MNNQAGIKTFLSFIYKVMVVHTLTYFMFGFIMSNLFNYKELFELDIIKDFMRPLNSPYVFAGPFLQPIRGLLFAIGLWPLRSIIFERKYGWLILWNLFIMIGILGTAAAAPGSMEGVIYSKLPIYFHLIGLPEMVLQTLTFSLILIWWVNRPAKQDIAANLSKKRVIFLRIMFAIMLSCFGYIGYAIGGILTALIAGVHVNLSSEAVHVRGQLLFVFAFVINVISVLIISSKRYFGKISFWKLFVIFWILDTASPLIYQSIFLRMMPIHLALILGFFPAVIIIFSYKMNYKNYTILNNNTSG